MKKQTWEDSFDDIKLAYWSEDAGCNYDKPLGLSMEEEVAVKLFIKKTLADHDRELVEGLEKMKKIIPRNLKTGTLGTPLNNQNEYWVDGFISAAKIHNQMMSIFRKKFSIAQEFIKKGKI